MFFSSMQLTYCHDNTALCVASAAKNWNGSTEIALNGTRRAKHTVSLT